MRLEQAKPRDYVPEEDGTQKFFDNLAKHTGIRSSARHAANRRGRTAREAISKSERGRAEFHKSMSF